MFGLPLAFAVPSSLAALAGLPALYYLLRITPPRPSAVAVSAAAAHSRSAAEGRERRRVRPGGCCCCGSLIAALRHSRHGRARF